MRLTTDTPKNNLEMALNLFYVKDKEVWVREYGKNGADISLLDLTREILSYQCPYVESDISDDDLIMMMPEWLFDDVTATEHVIGLLYQAAWVCAELREHLKQFEDTEMTPEAIKSAFTTDTLIKLAAQALETTPERLRELAAADKDGRVVVLPCKVGDTVWLTRTWVSERLSQPEAAALTGAYICGHGVYTFVTDKYGFQQDKIGKDVFLTREEAEKALETRKDETS